MPRDEQRPAGTVGLGNTSPPKSRKTVTEQWQHLELAKQCVITCTWKLPSQSAVTPGDARAPRPWNIRAVSWQLWGSGGARLKCQRPFHLFALCVPCHRTVWNVQYQMLTCLLRGLFAFKIKNRVIFTFTKCIFLTKKSYFISSFCRRLWLPHKWPWPWEWHLL